MQHHTFFLLPALQERKNLEILRAGGEFLGYLSLVERAQQAEIPYRQPEIPVGEIPEILLEFIRFGVLMIDPRAADVGFIRARFIGEGDILRPDEIRAVVTKEGDYRRERRVTVQVAPAVKLQQIRVDGAVGFYYPALVIARRKHALSPCRLVVDGEEHIFLLRKPESNSVVTALSLPPPTGMIFSPAETKSPPPGSASPSQTIFTNESSSVVMPLR